VANTKQARKRARQNSERRVFNRGYRSMFRTYVKRVSKAIESGDKQAAQEAFKQAEPVIDRVAGKGIIHKNKAARHKSRLNARIEAMEG
jgi:small subunit ribosomal protein S20